MLICGNQCREVRNRSFFAAIPPHPFGFSMVRCPCRAMAVVDNGHCVPLQSAQLGRLPDKDTRAIGPMFCAAGKLPLVPISDSRVHAGAAV